MLDCHDQLLRTACELDHALASEGIEHALIGGLAVLMRARERATFDIDFMIRGEHHARFVAFIAARGFSAIVDNENFGNFVGPEGARIDALYAIRPHGRAMLQRASQVSAAGISMQVAAAEDLIGLKMQALANNPARHRDWDDIRALYRARTEDYDHARVHEFVGMFGFEHEYRKIVELES